MARPIARRSTDVCSRTTPSLTFGPEGDLHPPVSAILTIGHSTHPLDHFLEMLRAHGVEHLVDVRAFPMSRRHPHFNREALAASLGGAGIGYTHMRELGGHREPRPDSINTAWKNESFRGYADYMQTPEF